VEVEQELEQFADRPTLICWGMKDFVFDRDFLQTWLKVLPEAEVERYEDAGHYVMEDAGDRITPRVKAFLARHPIRDATATPPRRQSGEGLPGYGARDLTTGSAG